MRQAHSISMHLYQAPDMELPKPQLAFDPCVTEFCDSPRRRYLCCASSLAIFLRNSITNGLSSRCTTERSCSLLSGQHSGLRVQAWQSQAALRRRGKSSRAQPSESDSELTDELRGAFGKLRFPCNLARIFCSDPIECELDASLSSRANAGKSNLLTVDTIY